MSQFFPLIRDRLCQIATQAATAAQALGDARGIDLDSRNVAELLQELDGVAARVGGIVERLSCAMDPQRIAE
jgi:hypothetical protein